jgi:DNA-binding transcriptional regulator GbsR (MarR family)
MPLTETTTRSSPTSLTRAELQVADAVGSLMELWGFRRQLGRIWSVLFLSEKPLAAPELCERLQISTGLLSMTLAELRRWGVVKSVAVPGDRKEHFEAETNIWMLVRRVLAEREKKVVESALAQIVEALAEVKAAQAEGDPLVKALARFRARRLEQLVALCRVGLLMLNTLLDGARLDLGPLKTISHVLGKGERDR